MLRKVLLGVLVAAYSASGIAGPFGPAKFEIVQADMRFTEPQTVAWASGNNRISKKSVVGGVHLDASGVYVNPVVTRDKDTGQVLTLGLIILNSTGYDTTYGSPNSLGVPKEIIFSVDGTKSISLPIAEGDSVWSDATSYNSVTRSASKNITESGLALMTRDQYREIISAKSLAVRIVGSKRSVTYETKDLSSSFLPNLRTFFEQKVQ